MHIRRECVCLQLIAGGRGVAEEAEGLRDAVHDRDARDAHDDAYAAVLFHTCQAQTKTRMGFWKMIGGGGGRQSRGRKEWGIQIIFRKSCDQGCWANKLVV